MHSADGSGRMTWNANWATSLGKGKLLKVALNQLRSALDERTSAVGRSVPGNCPVIASDEIVLSSWFTAWQSEMDTLITKYVDHTDNSGNWDGIATIPNWTSNNIITAIGDASRLGAPTDPLVSAAWMFQQYNIINLLRWYNGTTSGTSGNEKDSGVQADWATAESVMAADTPSGITSSSFIKYEATNVFQKTFSTVTKGRTPDSAISHDIDIYFTPTRILTTYETGFGYTENVWNLWGTASGITAFHSVTPGITLADGAFTQPAPSRDLTVTGVRFIEKYNIVGGFSYV